MLLTAMAPGIEGIWPSGDGASRAAAVAADSRDLEPERRLPLCPPPDLRFGEETEAAGGVEAEEPSVLFGGWAPKGID
jgi:hypothetical protein